VNRSSKPLTVRRDALGGSILLRLTHRLAPWKFHTGAA
jgi:hypothetical protein